MGNVNRELILGLAFLLMVGFTDLGQSQKRRTLRGKDPALAGKRGPEGPVKGRGGHRIPPRRLLERIGLSQDQLEQVETLKEDLKEVVEPLAQQGKEIGLALKAELESDLASPTTVGELVISRHEIGRQIKTAHEAFKLEFEDILTREQLEQLQKSKRATPRLRGQGLRQDKQGPPIPGDPRPVDLKRAVGMLLRESVGAGLMTAEEARVKYVKLTEVNLKKVIGILLRESVGAGLMTVEEAKRRYTQLTESAGVRKVRKMDSSSHSALRKSPQVERKAKFYRKINVEDSNPAIIE